MTYTFRSLFGLTLLAVWIGCPELLDATQIVTNPFVGVTLITRTETSPRAETMHIAEINLNAPGIGFELTPPGGTLETVRQTTLDYLNQQHAQLAINGEFFLPFPSVDPNSMLIGLAASNGNVYSSFEAPVQSYAIVTDAPALNIDPSNHASIVHDNTSFADGKHVQESVTLWNTIAGSAQIITNGVASIPMYLDATHPDGLLTPGGPASYSNSNSWYNLTNARTVIGLSQDNQTLFLFTVDNAGGSHGMTLPEIANLLVSDYGVYNALNLDGGGSTSMAMQNPGTGVGSLINVSSDNPAGRAEGSNLAIFATPVPEPTGTLMGGLVVMLALRRTVKSRAKKSKMRSSAA
jgi:exopolysaccharide biosynthesis protein